MTNPYGGASMDLSEVTTVLERLVAASCRVWVAGGWGVDALIGRQTRPHRDLDLAVDARDEAAAISVLGSRGYTVETDWRPARVELTHPDLGWVDLHPVVFGPDGHGRQADVDGGHVDYPPSAFAVGTMGQGPIPCLSVEQQIAFRRGYDLRTVDHHDLGLLRLVADSRAT